MNTYHSVFEPDNPLLAIMQSSVFDTVDMMFQDQDFGEAFPGLSPSSPTIGIPDRDIPLQRAPLACQMCRERHLKCNGLTPCSRCTLESRRCTYVRLRRGPRACKTQIARSISRDLAVEYATC
jgi:hypothetical protein